MKRKFLPAFRYSLWGYLRSSAGFYAVMVIITLLLVFYVPLRKSSWGVDFNVYGVAATICAFVVGIASIRDDLRLLTQNGVSRRTGFLSELLSVLTFATVLSAAGELLTGLCQLILAGNSHVFVGDWYQLFYLRGNYSMLSFSAHLMSGLLNTAFAFSGCLGGVFFSLLFWRLSRLWKIAAGISIPVLINGIPWLLYQLHISLMPLVRFLMTSPWNLIAFLLLLSGVTAGINWLLLRRAVIKSAK